MVRNAFMLLVFVIIGYGFIYTCLSKFRPLAKFIKKIDLKSEVKVAGNKIIRYAFSFFKNVIFISLLSVWYFFKFPISFLKFIILELWRVFSRLFLLLLNSANIWAQNRKFRDFIFMTMTTSVFGIMILYLKRVSINAESIHFPESLLLIIGFISMIILCSMFILGFGKQGIKDDFITFLLGFIIIIMPLFLIALSALALFEDVKNNGVKNSSQLYFLLGVSIYTIMMLLSVLKSILDKGSILFSCTCGVSVYLLILLFTTSGIGFYLTIS